MKLASVILLGICPVPLLIGGVLSGVQFDQVIRSHQALERLRTEVAELENIPVKQRTDLEADRIVWRQSDVEYFEERILPRDYAMLAGFATILATGIVCCVVGLIVRVGKSKPNNLVTGTARVER